MLGSFVLRSHPNWISSAVTSRSRSPKRPSVRPSPAIVVLRTVA